MTQSGGDTGKIAIGMTHNPDASPSIEMPLVLAPRLIFSAMSTLALLAGAIASGASITSTDAGLTLLVGWVLTQIVWNTLWTTIADTEWATPSQKGRDWKTGSPLRPLPYTQPGSASAQASVSLGQLQDWWRQWFWPRYGVMLASTAGAVLIGLVLSLVLGPQSVVLTIVAIGVPQIALLFSKANGQPHALARGCMSVGLPLLMGYALFAPLSVDILIAATGFAVAFAGMRQTGRARWLWMIGTGIVIGLMLITRRPLGAFALGILALPQVLLPQSRHVRVWLMVMLLAVGTAIA